MVTKTAEVAKVQVQLAATNAKLSQLLSKHGELNDELRCVKSLHAAGTTVPNDLSSVAWVCEGPAKGAKMTRSCESSSTTLLTAVFSALLTERMIPNIFVKR